MFVQMNEYRIPRSQHFEFDIIKVKGNMRYKRDSKDIKLMLGGIEPTKTSKTSNIKL